MLRIYDLQTEHLAHPNAVDAAAPRLSWTLESNAAGVVQKTYRITAQSGGTALWDSGTVESDAQLVRYGGIALVSRQKVRWSVEVTAADSRGQMLCASSDPAEFQMGLLQESDWQAQWITAGEDGEGRRPAAYLRRRFTVRPGLTEARIYQTAHGLYESFLNGTPTDADKFKPGLTSYYYRIQYQTFEVTDLLREGENEWNVTLADGWWRGVTGGTVRNNFGRTLDFLGQLELTYEDGTTEIIASGEGFETAFGPLLASDMQMGDIYDARKVCTGWRPVRLTGGEARTSGLLAVRIPSRSVPMREGERFGGRPFRDSNGDLVLDFGQNIAGNVKMLLRNTKSGQTVRLIHGETLDHQGNFTVANVNKTSLLLDAFQEVTYICKGGDTETYQPAFSVFGFRYVKVEGYDGEILPGDFTAVAVYSAMPEIGQFSCSHEGLNQLVKNARWSQKGNFLDAPVDCPTRERNTWTGDAQIYVPTACTFMDGEAFFEKWLQDQSIEQYESGKVGITFPSTSSVHDPAELPGMQAINPLSALAGPSGNGSVGEDATGWGDAAAWLPYSVYLAYGDPQILENQYETARKWLEYELSCAREDNPAYGDTAPYQSKADGSKDADYIFDTRFHYGEWNEAIGVREKVENYYRNPPEIREQTAEEKAKAIATVAYFIDRKSKAGDAVTATAYMARTADNVARMAKVLGKKEDAARYGAIAEKIRSIYSRYFIGSDGVIQKGHQAPYVRALAMNLCGNKKDLVLKQLLREIEDNGYALNTGFLSTPFLLPVLCDHGHKDIAYRILENEDLPSWLYPVKKGMTTIPESWGGVDLLEDSLNHYSYGSVCEFLFRYVAGIRPEWEHPGYKHFRLRPVPGGSLTHAEATLDTAYGTIRSAWRSENGRFHYECTIPVNTTADLALPDGSVHHLGSGRYVFKGGTL